MVIRAALLVGLLGGAGLFQQAPTAVDTSKIGPRVGASIPPVSGIDQFGRPQSLPSIYGPQGAMLVFFRSADW
jgi:hypothetical protein